MCQRWLRSVSSRGLTGKRVLHTVATESVLEGRAHEAVALAASVEQGKVHLEAGEVDDAGEDDEAKRTGGKVSQPDPGRDAEVAEEGPELADGREAEGGNRKEADPLARGDGAEREAARAEPLPP
jgi:hypothetical protein